MRKQILDALKARLTGVSDTILDRIAAKLAKTVTTEEQVATAVEGVTFQQVLESYGDSHATEAQQTAVRNYESKFGLKDGVKVDANGGQQPQTTTAQTPNPQEGTDTPAWAKALIDSNKALTDRLAALEGERTTAARRQKLGEIIDKLPENLRKAYERTPVESLTEEQFAELTAEITTEVDGIVKETAQRGAVFGRPSVTGGQSNQPEKLTEAQEKAISQRGGAVQQGQYF